MSAICPFIRGSASSLPPLSPRRPTPLPPSASPSCVPVRLASFRCLQALLAPCRGSASTLLSQSLPRRCLPGTRLPAHPPRPALPVAFSIYFLLIHLLAAFAAAYSSGHPLCGRLAVSLGACLGLSRGGTSSAPSLTVELPCTTAARPLAGLARFLLAGTILICPSPPVLCAGPHVLYSVGALSVAAHAPHRVRACPLPRLLVPASPRPSASLASELLLVAGAHRAAPALSLDLYTFVAGSPSVCCLCRGLPRGVGPSCAWRVIDTSTASPSLDPAPALRSSARSRPFGTCPPAPGWGFPHLRSVNCSRLGGPGLVPCACFLSGSQVAPRSQLLSLCPALNHSSAWTRMFRGGFLHKRIAFIYP